MLKYFILLSLLFSVSAWSQSKEQISAMLEQMKSSGQFSPEQIDAAKRKLAGMKDSDYNKLLNAAHEKAADPKFRNKVQGMMQKKK